jgi:hypothetical protein
VLNSAPNEWSVPALRLHMKHGPETRLPDGSREVARPLGFYSLRSRLRLAWAVFTGKADALFWPGQTPKAF